MKTVAGSLLVFGAFLGAGEAVDGASAFVSSATAAQDHDLGLDVALALDADVLLERHEGDPGLGEGVEDGDDLAERPTEPGEFAHDQAVAALQDARQLVEPPAFLGGLPGGGRLDESRRCGSRALARTRARSR